MNVVQSLRNYLYRHRIVSGPERDQLTITLALGTVPRPRALLPRRYVVSKAGTAWFSVKFLPRSWKFRPKDIVETYSRYAQLDFVNVPDLIAHFSTRDGYFFVEEHLESPVSLSDLVESGEIDSPDAAATVVRKMLAEIWELGEPPQPGFVRREKNSYHQYLKAFVEEGLLREITIEYAQRVIDANLQDLRQVISSGDIIDRNIFRVGPHWYLIDFEYAHHTLFFFKEAHRTVLNSPWAHDLSLEHLCPFLGSFPTDVAQLLSLAWEWHLYSEVLDNRAQQRAVPNLRHRFWNVVDSELAQRLDAHLARSEQQIAAKESEVRQLESENRNLDIRANSLQGELNQLQGNNEVLRTRVDELMGESERLRDQSQNLDVSRTNLEAEIDRWRGESSRLSEQAAALEAKVEQLQKDQAVKVQVEVSRLEGDNERLRARTSGLEAEIDRWQADNHRLGKQAAALEAKVGQQEGQIARNLADISRLEDDNERLRTHANGLEAEVGQLQAQISRLQGDNERLRTSANGLEAEVRGLQAESRKSELQRNASETEQNRLRANNEQLRAHVRTLDLQLRQLEAEGEQLLAQANTFQGKIKQSSRAVSNLKAEETRLQDLVSDKEVQLAKQRTESSGHITHLSQEIGRLTHQLAEQDQALSSNRQAIGDLHASISWRVTAPLRWGGRQAIRTAAALRIAASAVTGKPTGQSDPVEPLAERLVYHVDVFRIESGAPDDAVRVNVAGWCFARGRRKRLRLELRAGEKSIRRFKCGIRRDDVASSRPELVATSSLPSCGFDTHVDVTEHATHFTLLHPETGVVLAERSVDRLQHESAEQEIGRDTNLRYHVDRFQIASDPFSGDEFLYVIGWCFAPFQKDPLVLELWCDDRQIVEFDSELTNEYIESIADPKIVSVSSLPRCGFAEQIPVTKDMNHFELRSSSHSGVVLAQGSAEELRIGGASNGGDAEPPSMARMILNGAKNVHLKDLLSVEKWRHWPRVEHQRQELPSSRDPRANRGGRLSSYQASAKYDTIRPHRGWDDPPITVDSAGPHGRRDNASFDIQTRTMFDQARFFEKPLKVACFTHNLNLEGATKVLLDTVRGLKKRARVAPVVVSFAHGPQRAAMEAEGIPCHTINLEGSSSVMDGWTRAHDYQRSVDKVRQFLEQETPDVVMPIVLYNYFVVDAAFQLGIPSVWLIQESYDRPTMGRHITSLGLPTCERAFAQANSVVFGSRETATLYERFNTQLNFRVNHNGINIEELVEARSKSARESARNSLGLSTDEKIILSVGTVCARKDQGTLVDALASLAKKGLRFRSYIVGAREPDPYTRLVRRKIEESRVGDRVELVGETPDILRYFRAADLFAFTSLNECFPLVIAEAMAHALPIVTTSCIGVGEQVEFGANALRFDFRDVEGLAGQLEVLLKDDVTRTRMGNNSRRLFQQMQSYDKMVENYEQLILEAWRVGSHPRVDDMAREPHPQAARTSSNAL